MSQSPKPTQRPADDRSLPCDDLRPAAETGSGPPIAVRLAARAPSGAERGLARTVQAIEPPTQQAQATWRVTLAEASGWRARLGLGAGTLPLLVTLPPGLPLPLRVGDRVLLRVLQAVTGIHPRAGAEVRIHGRTVLLEGDDDFLRDLGELEITHGPCTDPGTSSHGAAPRQRGLIRIAAGGLAGYSDHRRQLRALEADGERLIFTGSWTGYGPGPLPPDASPQLWVALARLPRPAGGDDPSG
jgi:hypothetical protein